MSTNRLTDLQVRSAKPKASSYRLSDGGGLFLQITPAGGRHWKYRYRIHKKESTFTIGPYPEMGLGEARAKHLEARRVVAQGLNPTTEAKRLQMSSRLAQGNTFEAVSEEWFAQKQSGWSESYRGIVRNRLNKDLKPNLGPRPVTEITAPEVLAVIRQVEARGANALAHKCLSIVRMVLAYSVATGRCDRNVVNDLGGALKPVDAGHRAAITDPKRAGELMRMIDAYQGSMVVRGAMKLGALTFVRPGELRTMQWKDINFASNEWRFKVSKTETDHIVPLANQAIEILQVLQLITGNGHSKFVFPSAASMTRPMSNNAVLSALRGMGISKDEMSGHGFRAMARTLIAEELHYRPELIEHQLAHAVRGPLGRAYNRTEFLEERREMMQAWADYLDELEWSG